MREALARAKLLGDALRRHGVEGDDAFLAVSGIYLDRLSAAERAGVSSSGRARATLAAVAKDARVSAILERLADEDPTGDDLPFWYQHFVGTRFRAGSGKFFTPRPVARSMAALLPRTAGAVVMDPTCGGGTFLVEAARAWGRTPCRLVANDLERGLVDLARLVLALGAGPEHERSFSVASVYEPSEELDAWLGRVDHILANPPFSLPLEDVARPSPLFELGYRTSDAIFLDVCAALLRPGGRLVCLLPHSIVANAEFRRLRESVEQRFRLLAAIGLPEGVFHLAAGTTTRADIVLLERSGRPATGRRRTVFAFAPSVGVPLNRRSRGGDQLAEIVRDPSVTEALAR